MSDIFIQKKEIATMDDITALNPNLIKNSTNFSNLDGWQYSSSVDGIGNMSLETHIFWQNGQSNLIKLANSSSNENWLYSSKFSVEPNTTYKLSFGGFADTNVSSTDVFILMSSKSTDNCTNQFSANLLIANRINLSPSGLDNRNYIFTTPTNVTFGRIRFDNNGSKKAGSACGFYLCYALLQKYKVSTPQHLQSEYYLKTEVDSKIKTIQQQIDELKTKLGG